MPETVETRRSSASSWARVSRGPRRPSSGRRLLDRPPGAAAGAPSSPPRELLPHSRHDRTVRTLPMDER